MIRTFAHGLLLNKVRSNRKLFHSLRFKKDNSHQAVLFVHLFIILFVFSLEQFNSALLKKRRFPAASAALYNIIIVVLIFFLICLQVQYTLWE